MFQIDVYNLKDISIESTDFRGYVLEMTRNS